MKPAETVCQEPNSLDDQAPAYVGAPLMEDLRLFLAFAAGVCFKVLDGCGINGREPPGEQAPDVEHQEVKILTFAR